MQLLYLQPELLLPEGPLVLPVQALLPQQEQESNREQAPLSVQPVLLRQVDSILPERVQLPVQPMLLRQVDSVLPERVQLQERHL